MRRFSLSVLLSLISLGIFAQDDLMNILNQDTLKEINYTTATFKSTRIMNGHSIERMSAGQLDVRISHRFGTLNSGGYNFFGLDVSNIHLSLEYGILNWLMIGVGRSTNTNHEPIQDSVFKAKMNVRYIKTEKVITPRIKCSETV